MELRHLRYFVRVAEELHFGRAADLLGISQPPLSQQIRALELELGVDLFDRTSRRVRLTEAGRLFLAEARRTLDQAAHAVDIARRVQSGETGELAIGFGTSVPLISFVTRALLEYRAAYPAVHLTLGEMSRDAQIAGIAEGRIDLGLFRGFDPPSLPESLIAKRLWDEDIRIAMRDDHPLAASGKPVRLAEIADEPFVLYEPDLGAGFTDHLGLLFRRAGRQLRVAQEVSGLTSLLGLVAAGFGITALSRSLSRLRLDHLVCRRLDEPDAVSRLWLIHRESLSPAARRFTALLAANADSATASNDVVRALDRPGGA
ncbi:MAG TPA: LysR substrate-binding domain-containing protein [Sphingomonas sp.]|nr:LysR substrate-binding domain-containing protein [Sphingomonas sp.]